jgi:hypothetical protein
VRAFFLENDNPAAIAAAEPVLAVAEELDLGEVLADTLITKGGALAMLGRRYEGLAVVGAGRELAGARGLAATELRAIINSALIVAYSEPAEALRLARAGLALAERMGIRDRILGANAIESARALGEWEWATSLAEEQLATGAEGQDLVLLLSARGVLRALVGERDDATVADITREAETIGDRVGIGQVTADLALLDGRFAAARQAAEETASLDPLNAPPMLVLAAHAAAWDRDLDALARISRTFDGSMLRGRLLGAQGRAIRAAVAGLEGRREEALAGFRRAAREHAELGTVVDRSLTAIDMAAVLGGDDPEVRTEIAFARETFARLGAGPYLERLEAVLAAPPGAGPGRMPSEAEASVAAPTHGSGE